MKEVTEIIQRHFVLIVPLWNWNTSASDFSKCQLDVLIVPLWNWNLYWEVKHKQMPFCFNRTFMELKFTTPSPLSAKEKVLIVPLWNWNYHQIFACYLISGFNRTFMELKYHWSISVPKITAVLIVPLWNWNFVDQLTPDTSILSFNRTFMELKYYL